MLKGREVRVRPAAHKATAWVKNIPTLVHNDKLKEAFQRFGEVERAVVVVDDRGNSKGYGFVEFAQRSSVVSGGGAWW